MATANFFRAKKKIALIIAGNIQCCVTDSHDMTLTVQMALNVNTNKQTNRTYSTGINQTR